VKNRSIRVPGAGGFEPAAGDVQPADPSTDAEATAAGIAEIAVMTARRGRPGAAGDPAVTASLAGAGGLLGGTIDTPGRLVGRDITGSQADVWEKHDGRLRRAQGPAAYPEDAVIFWR
jgi:hypothetical protein